MSGEFSKMHAAEVPVRRRFMKMRVLAGLILIAAAMMGMASCGHYTCGSGPILSATGCTAGTTGLSSGGTTGSASAAFAFAVDTAGTIDGYTLNTTADTFAATSNYTAPEAPVSDGGRGMVVAQSQYLYAGFGSTDQIYGWSIDSTGNLTALSQSPYSAPFMGDVGGGYGIQSIITNPTGTFLFFADLLNDGIYVYSIGTGGALTEVSGSPFSVPFGPVNMATDGLGKYLYVTESFDDHTGTAVAAYTIGGTGALTSVAGSPFTTASYDMWEVQGEPTGKYLVGTSGKNLDLNGTDDDHLYVFSITQSGASAGAITPVSGSPFLTTYSPYNIAVQSNSSGNLVYSFSINDTLTGFNSIEGYEIGTGGALTAVTGSPFSDVALGSWGQFDQSGQFLFVYSAVDNSGTYTYSLGPLDVASGGALTQPIGTTTLSTVGFWAVTDPQ
jgi:6-phosphogluconolactonase